MQTLQYTLDARPPTVAQPQLVHTRLGIPHALSRTYRSASPFIPAPVSISPTADMRGLYLVFSLLYLGIPLCVKAGTLSKGSNCSVASQRLNLGTYQFFSECDSVTYCNAATGQCEPKRCRKDVFPFGYADDSELPPMCPSGKFCPDEEDQCLDVLPVDSPCQFNRDGKTIHPLAYPNAK